MGSHYAPHEKIIESDLVNLGFVINVIENIDERIEALKAFDITNKILVVGVMLSSQKASGKNYGDGFLTSRNIFKILYAPRII